jgi:hypothetical protein
MLEQAGKCFPEILDEVEAISDLHGIGSALGGTLAVDVAPISTDYPDIAVRFQPFGERIRVTIR